MCWRSCADGRRPTLQLPDRGELEHEAAAHPGAGQHVAAAGACEPPRERQAESCASPPLCPAADARLEDALAERRIEAGPVVAHGETHAAVGGRQLERDSLARVPTR